MCQAQSTLVKHQYLCPSSGTEGRRLNFGAVATASLDGKLGTHCFSTFRGLVFLGIQVSYVPLNPWQLGVSTGLMAFLGDEAVGKRGGF